MKKAETNIYSQVNEVFVKTLVTQKILNNSVKPIETEIYIDRYSDKNIFSSFEAQIGNSKKVKSKVIKKEKAEEKYTDSIASGNAGIYTTIDENDKNIVIVHIGNIPPKEELIFISEFIQYTESSNNFYEYEFFRNVPILKNKGDNIPSDIFKGILEIKTKSKIININKKFLFDEMIIEKEKHDKDKNSFIMKYKYEIDSIKVKESLSLLYFLDDFPYYEEFYIPASKLLFNLESNDKLFYQNSLKNKDEQSYIFNYKIMEKNNKEDLELNPALFIFLIDQSGSMSGSPIKVASKALLLFLQSLPAGSYYQIIGFGTNYKIYDNMPKEYNQKNLQKSIKIVEKLKGDMGRDNIYPTLKYIYNSIQNYEKILLPRNIFLLTDGEIDYKKETLTLIENNSNNFSVYSFGIGNDFDEDLIKNAGIVGKGNYSFCQNIAGLNQIIISNLNDICTSFITNFNINSNLDDINLYNTINVDKVMKNNKIYRFGYIAKENLSKKKIYFKMKYKLNKIDTIKKYEIKPIELPPGEELSQLIIYHKILKCESEEEKIKLALKYQLFIEGTSLFNEIELSKKLTEAMEQREIKHEKKESKYNKNQNKFDDKLIELEEQLNDFEIKSGALEQEAKEKLKLGDRNGAKRILINQEKIIAQMKQIEGQMAMIEEQKMMLDISIPMKDAMSALKNANACVKEASKGMSIEDLESMKENMEDVGVDKEELNDFFKDYDNDNEYIEDKLDMLEYSLVGKDNIKIQEKEEEDDLNKYLVGDSEPIKKKEEKSTEKKAEEIVYLDLKKKKML